MATQVSPAAARTTAGNTGAGKRVHEPERVGARLGGDLEKLEDQLIRAYGKPDPSEKELKSLELKYKRASLALEGFMQLMKNKHETLMRGIQALGLR